ncbi:hypothetical protein V8J82_11235 [Gymnodinialimonas sp. 2305UL16-5]|uniref:hypothetical protein n=1 Tax=Gymnodinialimonas mytili TaxID=3126503 RepID=UPI0030B08606
MTQATDLLMLDAKDVRVAARVRRPGFASRYAIDLEEQDLHPLQDLRCRMMPNGGLVVADICFEDDAQIDELFANQRSHARKAGIANRA